jgi:hypothetical protein
VWTKKQCAAVLAAATFFLAVGLLLFPAAGRPAIPPRLSLVEATAYVRGWIDAAAPPGYFATAATCKPARGGYSCSVVVSNGPQTSCARALITGYRFPGPIARIRCKGGPSS